MDASLTRERLAAAIDQTLLSPTVGFAEAAAWMERNAGLGFASLCVAPFLVPLAAQRLAGTGTRVCSVAAFPLGYTTTESKAEEATRLVELGCDEVDVVINLGAVIEGQREFVVDDLAAVVAAVDKTSLGKGLVKVIIETGRLDESQIRLACECALESGAAFVKTSTGFGPRGASVEDVVLMRSVVEERMRIKAAGGIRDLGGALAMLDAGADRLGTSAGAEILGELATRG